MEMDEKIEFRSPLRLWCEWLILSAYLFLLGLNFIFFKIIGPYIVFIDFVIGFGIFYGFRALFACNTHLEVINGQLIIEQYNRNLNKTQILKIPIELISGYEINQVSRGQTALFIYDRNFNYYKYSLLKTNKEAKISAYLDQYLPLLTYKNNPYFTTFLSAFLFAIKRSMIFFLATLFGVGLVFYVNLTYQLWPESFTFFFSLLTGFIGWWFIIRKAVKNKRFRFGANYWIINFFFYFSPLLFLLAFQRIEMIREKPLKLNNCLEIGKHPQKKLYIINNVSYNPNLILLSRFDIGSRNRGGIYNVNHYISTPIGEGESINPNRLYSYWLVSSYKQRLRRTPQFYQKIQDFNAHTKTKFIHSLQQKPTFYIITKFNENIFQLFATTSLVPKQFFILEPHWESIANFKNKNKQNAILLLLTFIAANILGCLNIASKR